MSRTTRKRANFKNNFPGGPNFVGTPYKRFLYTNAILECVYGDRRIRVQNTYKIRPRRKD